MLVNPQLVPVGQGWNIATRALALTLNIPLVLQVVVTGGYTTIGDNGNATYKRVAVQPTHAGKFQSLDGAWWELSESRPSVAMFGAVSDDTTNATPAFANANAYMIAVYGGGTFTYNGKYVIDTALSIGPNVTLAGPMKYVGSPSTNASSNYSPLPHLQVNSAITITLLGGSGITGALMYRKGMTFPANGEGAFAGNCVTAGGDDAFIEGNMILGFTLGYFSTGFQRPWVERNYFDCTGSMEISNCQDVPRIKDNHQWPFASIALTGNTAAAMRSGNMIYLHDIADWAKMNNNFSWGVLVGTRLDNVENVNCIGNGHDNPYDSGTGLPVHINSIGFAVNGAVKDIRFISCQAAAADTAGVVCNGNAASKVLIRDFNNWGASTHGVLINNGDVQIQGGEYREQRNDVIAITNANSNVLIDGLAVKTIPMFLITSVPLTKVQIGSNIDFGDYNGQIIGTSTLTAPVIASAAAITIPNNGYVFTISGTTNIGLVSNGWLGRVVYLTFTSGLTITSSTGSLSAIHCLGGTNKVFAAGDTLAIVHDGTQWRQS